MQVVENALARGDIRIAVDALRAWLETAKPGDPEAALANCLDQTVRSKLTLLMRDLVSRYPYTLLGAPVLMYLAFNDEHSGDLRPSSSYRINLPRPSLESMEACSNLQFVGWLPIDTPLPIELPYRPESYELQVPVDKIVSAVALFRSTPDIYEFDHIDIPNAWWASLFQGAGPVSVHLSTRLLLPYPDALEASRVMLSVAQEESQPSRGPFLTDGGWAWAMETGALFKETCRHYFPT